MTIPLFPALMLLATPAVPRAPASLVRSEPTATACAPCFHVDLGQGDSGQLDPDPLDPDPLDPDPLDLELLDLGDEPDERAGSPLERALRTVRSSALRADLFFLADDALGGRDTPSADLSVTALFLASRLERLGFETSGPGSWFHDYPVFDSALDAARSGLELRSGQNTQQLEFGSDYYFYRSQHLFELPEATLSGSVREVDAGLEDTITREQVAGRWALVLDLGQSIRRVRRKCAEAGALGVLFAETQRSKNAYAERFGGIAKRVLEGGIGMTAPGSASDELPIVMLSARGLERLRELGPLTELLVREDRVPHIDEIAIPNVAGFWPGRDPSLSREVIILSAHFDHVGTRGDDVFNGADDNGSGTAGLLAVAEALKEYGPLERSVLFLWLSGEEKGLWGSLAWTRQPRLPEGCRPVADINIDMIGRNAPDLLYLTPTTEHAEFNAVADAAYALAALEGFPELRSQDADWNRSDHYNFSKELGIPVAFLSSGEHQDYHQPSDTPERIDYDKVARTTRLIVRMLDRLGSGAL